MLLGKYRDRIFGQINSIFLQNYWFGFDSLERWKWFEFVANAVYTVSRTELEINSRFPRPKGIEPSQLLLKSCVDRTSFAWDHVKLERRIPPGAGRTFLPKLTPRAWNSSLFVIFFIVIDVFYVWILSFHANWLQSLFVRFISLSKVCEQQPVLLHVIQSSENSKKRCLIGMFLLKTRF